MDGSVLPDQITGDQSTALGETLPSFGEDNSRQSDAVFDTIAPAKGVA
jgi:hypothetical protein